MLAFNTKQIICHHREPAYQLILSCPGIKIEVQGLLEKHPSYFFVKTWWISMKTTTIIIINMLKREREQHLRDY